MILTDAMIEHSGLQEVPEMGSRGAKISLILDTLTAVPIWAVTPLVRPWHMHWGANDAEVAAAMPGDEMVPRAQFNATRSITIDAPPEQVWPWITQLGYRRAGSIPTTSSTTRASGVLTESSRSTNTSKSAT